jgi:hypothetical protein
MDDSLSLQRRWTGLLALSLLAFGVFVAFGAVWFNRDLRKAAIILGCSTAFVGAFAAVAILGRRRSADTSPLPDAQVMPGSGWSWISLGLAVLAWGTLIGVSLFPPAKAPWALAGLITVFLAVWVSFFLGIICLGNRGRGRSAALAGIALVADFLLVALAILRVIFRV